MANDFFTKTGWPATGSSGASASARAEIAAIEAAFDKLPGLTGNGGKIVAVNSGATALEALTTTGTGSAVRSASPTFTGTVTLAHLDTTGSTTLGNAAADVLTVNPDAVFWPNNPTHSGNHIFSGNVTVNGNTVIGNASGDTLTVAPNAVTWSNNPTHSGNHVFSGNVSIEGNTTLGNASGDSLTVAPNAVTWSNDPTHSGNHTFSGNVTVNGNAVIGNASGDTLTIAPAAVTWSNNPTHSGNHTFSGDVVFSSGVQITSGAFLAGGGMRVNTGNSTNMTVSDARLAGALWIGDGITTPTATVGFAAIYIDSGTGDLTVMFGDGDTVVLAAN